MFAVFKVFFFCTLSTYCFITISQLKRLFLHLSQPVDFLWILAQLNWNGYMQILSFTYVQKTPSLSCGGINVIIPSYFLDGLMADADIKYSASQNVLVIGQNMKTTAQSSFLLVPDFLFTSALYDPDGKINVWCWRNAILLLLTWLVLGNNCK